jgi:cytochrome c-type biogenesis protein
MHNPIEASLALLAGVLTIASPCILPILPILLGTAVAQSSRTRPLFIVAGFVLTFAALGMLLGVVSSAVDLVHGVFRNVSIAMLGLAGLMQDNAGGFLLGVSLGAVWTPCAGPVLASILALVAKAQDVGWSATLLLLYAAGAGLPMLVIAYGGQFMRSRVRQLARHTLRLQQLFGVLVMLTAGAIYFQYDVLAYAWLADFSTTLKGI